MLRSGGWDGKTLPAKYLQHLSSSVFAIPPGMKEGQTYIGQQLFETP